MHIYFIIFLSFFSSLVYTFTRFRWIDVFFPDLTRLTRFSSNHAKQATSHTSRQPRSAVAILFALCQAWITTFGFSFIRYKIYKLMLEYSPWDFKKSPYFHWECTQVRTWVHTQWKHKVCSNNTKAHRIGHVRTKCRRISPPLCFYVPNQFYAALWCLSDSTEHCFWSLVERMLSVCLFYEKNIPSDST